MFRIGGDGAQRLRRGAEQDVIDHGLVLKRDDLDLRRHGEHDVVVRHVEQFRLTVFQPFGPRETLALRTVAVATRNGNFPLRVLWANSVMVSWGPTARPIAAN